MPSPTLGDRKLQDVVRDLAPLEEQGKAEGFFNNAENEGKLGGLVEDIRDAMMDYQVRALSLWISIWSKSVSDFVAARHLRQATRYLQETTRPRRQESLNHGESPAPCFVFVG